MGRKHATGLVVIAAFHICERPVSSCPNLLLLVHSQFSISPSSPFLRLIFFSVKILRSPLCIPFSSFMLSFLVPMSFIFFSLVFYAIFLSFILLDPFSLPYTIPFPKTLSMFSFPNAATVHLFHTISSYFRFIY